MTYINNTYICIISMLMIMPVLAIGCGGVVQKAIVGSVAAEGVRQVVKASKERKSQAEDHVRRGYEAQFVAGDYNGAIHEYSEAIHCDGNCASAFSYRGYARLMKCDFYEAIADCNEAIQRDPRLGLAYCTRSCACYFIGEAAQSQVDYVRAIQLDPSLGQTWHAAKQYVDRRVAGFP